MFKVRYSTVIHHNNISVLVPFGLQTPYGSCVNIIGAKTSKVIDTHTGQAAIESLFYLIDLI
jgi:hypothetical protein